MSKDGEGEFLVVILVYVIRDSALCHFGENSAKDSPIWFYYVP